LWIESEGALLIADAHLGYSWAQRRRGELGPVADGAIERKLREAVEELKPRSIVFLGDLVHAPRPGLAERESIERILRELQAQTTVLVVRGNHDRGFLRDFGHLGLPPYPDWRAPGLLAVHGDRIPETFEDHLVVGHFHPTLKIRDAANAAQRLPLFLVSDRATVMPAFSPFAAGFGIDNPWPAELTAIVGPAPHRLIVCSGKRALELPSPDARLKTPGNRSVPRP
jgi:putative SbcD/Mre11-related phosphoesterase